MKVLGVIFSNIHDKDLGVLTASRTLASVPFGGRYRLIDFVLSNMVNSGITKVGVITKTSYQSLMDHVGSGKNWDLSRKNGGLMVLPPYGAGAAQTPYNSRYQAIKNIESFLRRSDERYVVMSDCDTVCNIDLGDVVQFHKDKAADITVVYRKKKISDLDEKKERMSFDISASGKVIKAVNSDRLVGDLNIYTNIFVINREFLLNLLDNERELGISSFKYDIIIRGATDFQIYGYEHTNYFASIDTVANYYKHSMELLDKNIRDSLFSNNGADIYTKVRDSAPARFCSGANVRNSVVADGCIIDGEVVNSILFRGVKVAKGAVVSNSIIFQDTVIGENSKLHCVIADKQAHILDSRQLSGHETHPYFITKNCVI